MPIVITDDDPVELAHVDKRRTDVAGAECRENRRPAEILPSGIADGGGFAVIVRVVFLHQGVVAFPKNPARLVADDDAANRASAFVISLLRQQNSDAHEIRIGQLFEKSVCRNGGQALRRKMGDNVEHFVGHGRLLGDKRLCHSLANRGVVLDHIGWRASSSTQQAKGTLFGRV